MKPVLFIFEGPRSAIRARPTRRPECATNPDSNMTGTSNAAMPSGNAYGSKAPVTSRCVISRTLLQHHAPHPNPRSGRRRQWPAPPSRWCGGSGCRRSAHGLQHAQLAPPVDDWRRSTCSRCRGWPPARQSRSARRPGRATGRSVRDEGADSAFGQHEKPAVPAKRVMMRCRTSTGATPSSR